jgi:hypothetical protein
MRRIACNASDLHREVFMSMLLRFLVITTCLLLCALPRAVSGQDTPDERKDAAIRVAAFLERLGEEQALQLWTAGRAGQQPLYTFEVLPPRVEAEVDAGDANSVLHDRMVDQILAGGEHNRFAVAVETQPSQASYWEEIIPDPDTVDWKANNRPGYRYRGMEPIHQSFYDYISAQRKLGKDLSLAENAMIRHLQSLRRWPEAPVPNAFWKAFLRYQRKQASRELNVAQSLMLATATSLGLVPTDTPPTPQTSRVLTYLNSRPFRARNWLELYLGRVESWMGHYVAVAGVDMRPVSGDPASGVLKGDPASVAGTQAQDDAEWRAHVDKTLRELGYQETKAGIEVARMRQALAGGDASWRDYVNARQRELGYEEEPIEKEFDALQRARESGGPAWAAYVAARGGGAVTPPPTASTGTGTPTGGLPDPATPTRSAPAAPTGSYGWVLIRTQVNDWQTNLDRNNAASKTSGWKSSISASAGSVTITSTYVGSRTDNWAKNGMSQSGTATWSVPSPSLIRPGDKVSVDLTTLNAPRDHSNFFGIISIKVDVWQFGKGGARTGNPASFTDPNGRHYLGYVGGGNLPRALQTMTVSRTFAAGAVDGQLMSICVNAQGVGQSVQTEHVYQWKKL